MNLLKETLEDITNSGHTSEDIVFIGSRSTGHRCTWAEFQVLANRDYDAGFGAQEVASDLEIVFSDGSTMTRSEYDGSESWCYSRPFVAPADTHRIVWLFADPPRTSCGWETLKSLADRIGEVQP